MQVHVFPHVTALLSLACTYFALQSPHKGSLVHDHSTDAENSKILTKLDHNQKSSRVPQEGPRTKKFMLHESIIATLVHTKNEIRGLYFLSYCLPVAGDLCTVLA